MRKKNNRIVSVYTKSSEISPAGYYRIVQFVKRIDNVNFIYRPLLSNRQFRIYLNIRKNTLIKRIIVEAITYAVIVSRVTYFLLSDLIKRPDLIIVSRVFVPRLMPSFFIPIINRITKSTNFIWDFDDNIIDSNEVSKKTFYYLSKKSTTIVVTHDFLKSLIPQDDRHKVIMLPTTDGDIQANMDIMKVMQNRRRLYDSNIQLVWVGTAGNLPHLEKIIPFLDDTALEIERKNSKKLSLSVVCNLPITLKPEHLIIKNIVWSRSNAIVEIQNAHIGIMPLIDNQFTRGKGGFKLVQYLSSGLPVIASNVGFNKEVVNTDCGYLIEEDMDCCQWKDKILELSDNWEKLNNLSEGAYEQWDKKFSFGDICKKWEAMIEINTK